MKRRGHAGRSRPRLTLSLDHRYSFRGDEHGLRTARGTAVPTLRPLLAVAGPPRQYGPKPCFTWPLAGLQRPRPLRRSSPKKGPSEAPRTGCDPDFWCAPEDCIWCAPDVNWFAGFGGDPLSRCFFRRPLGEGRSVANSP